MKFQVEGHLKYQPPGIDRWFSSETAHYENIQTRVEIPRTHYKKSGVVYACYPSARETGTGRSLPARPTT